MKAGELVVDKKDKKRIILLSEDHECQKELESVLEKIHMEFSIYRYASVELMGIEESERINPHAIICDIEIKNFDLDSVKGIRLQNKKIPVILLHKQLTTHEQLEFMLEGVSKIIKKDTLRFCGKILYQVINGWTGHRYFELEAKTRKRILDNLSGLHSIQSFWSEASPDLSYSYKKILTELEDTCTYLAKLERYLRSMQTPSE